jgi:hypothetical protein
MLPDLTTPWIIPPCAAGSPEFNVGAFCPRAQEIAIARDKPSRNHRQVSALISTIDNTIDRNQPAGRGRATKNEITSTLVLTALYAVLVMAS